jgi:hypothetical protein
LFLEYLSDHRFFDPNEPSEVEAVYGGIARFHGIYEAEAPARVLDIAVPETSSERDSLWNACHNGQGHLHSEVGFRRAFARVRDLWDDLLASNLEFASQLGPLNLERLLEIEDEVVGHVLEFEPVTLLHGDLHRWNILLGKADFSWDVRLVDWEFAGLGLRQFDLSYLFLDDPRQLVGVEPLPTIGYGAQAELALREYYQAMSNCTAYPISWDRFVTQQRYVNLVNSLDVSPFLLTLRNERHYALPSLVLALRISERLGLL